MEEEERNGPEQDRIMAPDLWVFRLVSLNSEVSATTTAPILIYLKGW